MIYSLFPSISLPFLSNEFHKTSHTLQLYCFQTIWWAFSHKVLAKVYMYSTPVGQVWITIKFYFWLPSTRTREKKYDRHAQFIFYPAKNVLAKKSASLSFLTDKKQKKARKILSFEWKYVNLRDTNCLRRIRKKRGGGG